MGQIGTDRILWFSFTNDANSEKTYHLVFEFFSAGNILLLSSTYTILAVLRTFRPTIPIGGDPAAFQVYELGALYVAMEKHVELKGYGVMTLDKLRGILGRVNG